MKNPDTQKLQKHIDRLSNESLILNNEIRLLHIIGEKINIRGYRNFDKETILQELGQLQNSMGKLHDEILSINNLLK